MGLITRRIKLVNGVKIKKISRLSETTVGEDKENCH